MAKTLTLTVCPKCEKKIELNRAQIRGIVDSPTGRRINYYCPYCYHPGSVFFTWKQVKSKKAEADQFIALAKKREIGKLVKGFAIDLEAVETLEDITMFWTYQELVRPRTIPKEKP